MSKKKQSTASAYCKGKRRVAIPHNKKPDLKRLPEGAKEGWEIPMVSGGVGSPRSGRKTEGGSFTYVPGEGHKYRI